METELPSDQEPLGHVSDAPVRTSSQRILLLTVTVGSAVAAIFALTLSARSHDSRLRTSAVQKLHSDDYYDGDYHHGHHHVVAHREFVEGDRSRIRVTYGARNPHGVCEPPAENFDQMQRGCPSDRQDSCLAGNRDYRSFREAWEACGRVPECGAIMRWTTGNFYLRRANDPVVDIQGAWSMIYTCNGQGVETKQTEFEETTTCSPPMGPWNVSPKGCPGHFPNSCVAKNQGFRTFFEAWQACETTDGCDLIMRWTEHGRYYLRRHNDPNIVKAGAASIRFECLGRDEQLDYDERDTTGFKHGHTTEG